MHSETLHYDDICIVPEIKTDIKSRSECKVLKNFHNSDYFYLPIFTAPMSTVVDFYNYMEYNKNHIIPIIPRSESIHRRIINLYTDRFYCFISFSLKEIKDEFIYKPVNSVLYNRKTFICIDVANGHMSDLIGTIKSLKKLYPNMVIMAGNIANPKTYELYEEAGCDYLRLNIGSGSGCTTSSNTGIGYSIFSLLKETYEIKRKINGKCQIIADGGIRNYDHIQKALIYADYVMIGGLFNQMFESAGKMEYGNFYWKIFNKKIINPFKTLFYKGRKVSHNGSFIEWYESKRFKKLKELFINGKVDLRKTFYGMSTKIAQKEMGNKTLKTSEGLVKKQNVKYTLNQWVENEIDYLRSAMSYTNSRTLDEYKESQWVRITKRYYNK